MPPGLALASAITPGKSAAGMLGWTTMAKLATAIFMIGVKSVVGSNGTFLYRLGAMVKVLMAINKV